MREITYDQQEVINRFERQGKSKAAELFSSAILGGKTNLSLAGCSLQGEDVRILLKALPIFITVLSLKDNVFGNDGAMACAANSTLKALDLSENDIWNEGAKALAANSTLRSLDLSLIFP